MGGFPQRTTRRKPPRPTQRNEQSQASAESAPENVALAFIDGLAAADKSPRGKKKPADEAR